MTLTVIQLLECAPALQALISQPHKGRVAFRIRKIALALDPLIRSASASRDSLFNDANSDLVGETTRKLKPECVHAVLSDPLFSETVEVDMEPLTADDLADAVISPDQIGSLGPLVN